MENWSILRTSFYNHRGSNNEDAETPALKQPRRASSPSVSFKLRPHSNSFSQKGQQQQQQLKIIDENPANNSMPLTLPGINDNKSGFRRERTFHLGPTNSGDKPGSSTQARRYSSFQPSVQTKPQNNDETATTATTSPPELGPNIGNLLATRFTKTLLNSTRTKRISAANLPSMAAFTAANAGPTRDPNRVPLFRLFRATAISVSKWLGLYKRGTNFSVTAINLSDIMALTNPTGGSSSSNSNKKKEKKSTTTAAVDEEGNVVKFNMDDFKSNVTMKLTDRAKKILSRPPAKRTDEDVHYVMIALKSVPQIGEYPLAILRLIVRYGFFECFDARRVLIRQGHLPAAFYFILYGEVAVAVCPDPGEPAKLAVKLKRGESFGELAIITGLPRQSTCVTLGYCEFIKLWKDEYVQIFKVGGMANFNNTEVLQFLKSSDLMTGWPLDLLKTNPGVIVFSYFKAGSVVVKDIRKSPWLVILKSGRADVVAIIPKQGSFVSEKTGLLQQENEKSARQALSILFHLSKQEFDKELTSSRFRRIRSCWKQTRQPLALLSYRSLTSANFYDDEAEAEIRAANIPSTFLQRGRQRSAAAAVVAAAQNASWKTPPTATALGSSRSSRVASNSSLADSDNETKLKEKKTGRKTMFNILNAGNEEEEDDDDNSPTSATYIGSDHNQYDFITLQQLSGGNVFGLESHLKLTDCRLLLLSQGCECILLNWDFFRQHCSSVKMAQVHTWAVSSNYPSAKAVEEMYQDEINWLSFRKYLVKTAVTVKTQNTL